MSQEPIILQHGEIIARLRCNHRFHANCWDDFEKAREEAIRNDMSTLIAGIRVTQPEIDRNKACPTCRGSGQVATITRFIDPIFSHVEGADFGTQVGVPTHTSPLVFEPIHRTDTDAPMPPASSGSMMSFPTFTDTEDESAMLLGSSSTWKKNLDLQRWSDQHQPNVGEVPDGSDACSV